MFFFHLVLDHQRNISVSLTRGDSPHAGSDKTFSTSSTFLRGYASPIYCRAPIALLDFKKAAEPEMWLFTFQAFFLCFGNLHSNSATEAWLTRRVLTCILSESVLRWAAETLSPDAQTTFGGDFGCLWTFNAPRPHWQTAYSANVLCVSGVLSHLFLAIISMACTLSGHLKMKRTGLIMNEEAKAQWML